MPRRYDRLKARGTPGDDPQAIIDTVAGSAAHLKGLAGTEATGGRLKK